MESRLWRNKHCFFVVDFIKGTVHPRMESSPDLFTLMSILTCTTLLLKQNTTDLLFPVMSFTYSKICNCIIVVYWHQRTWHVTCCKTLKSQHLENPHKYVVFYPLVLFSALSSLSHALLTAVYPAIIDLCVQSPVTGVVWNTAVPS